MAVHTHAPFQSPPTLPPPHVPRSLEAGSNEAMEPTLLPAEQSLSTAVVALEPHPSEPLEGSQGNH